MTTVVSGGIQARARCTVRSPFVPTHRFDAGQRIDGLVESLNALQPAVLVAYASMIRGLADEQLRGHLRIWRAEV